MIKEEGPYFPNSYFYHRFIFFLYVRICYQVFRNGKEGFHVLSADEKIPVSDFSVSLLGPSVEFHLLVEF